jgi:CRP/FNR family transcriptional regulator, cyclic AMP receptor protein
MEASRLDSGPSEVAIEARERVLRGHYLFRTLAPDLMREAARLSRVERLARGAVLFHKGEEGDALYGVITGAVRIYVASSDGRELTLALMEPGDVFGEIALLDGLPRTADAAAVTAATLLAIPRAPFIAWVEHEPRMMRHVIEMLCERLRQVNEDLSDVIFLDLRARLAKKLLALAVAHGQSAEDGVRIELRLSQTDLAFMLGVTREAVNKQLHVLIREGLLRLDHGHVVLLDRPRLLAVARIEALPDG